MQYRKKLQCELCLIYGRKWTHSWGCQSQWRDSLQRSEWCHSSGVGRRVVIETAQCLVHYGRPEEEVPETCLKRFWRHLESGHLVTRYFICKMGQWYVSLLRSGKVRKCKIIHDCDVFEHLGRNMICKHMISQLPP